MNKIKDFFKKTLKKIKEIYFTSYDFVTKNKWYFIIGISTIILFIILNMFLKLYISILIALLIGSVSLLLYLKRGMFVKKKTKEKKKTKINETKKTSVKKVKTKKKKIKTEPTYKKVIRYVLIFFCVLFLIGLVGVGAFFTYIVTTTEKFNPNKLIKAESTILYDKDGVEFARIGAENREKITYDELSEVLVDAIIATEDSRFFQHNGVDIPRFAKATIGQLLGKAAGGASTLTMQLAKNNYNGIDAHGIKGVIRKFRDVYVSVFQIEKNYTKQEIIELYVNDIQLGITRNAYGVEQASKVYFGKSAKDLSLSEAALLAGLFQAPGAYDPFKNPEGASARRNQVLYLMQLHGYITAEEAEIAKSIPVESLLVENNSNGSEYQAFIDTVVSEIYEYTKSLSTDGKGINPYNVSLEIYTTMDRKKQDSMNNIFTGKSYKWENTQVQAGSVVLDINTGAIVAVGNGRNRTGVWLYNYATQMRRQIGSTAKPLYDYGPGIEYNNWSTYTPFVDEAHSYSSGNQIFNWYTGYVGLTTLRDCVVNSRNIPALKAFQSVKNSNIRQFVENLGLSPEYEGNDKYIHEAHSIGSYGDGKTSGENPLSMAAAYAAFGNGGYYHSPYSFTKFVYRETEEVVENKTTTRKAMSSQTSYMMTNILKSTAAGYGYIRHLGGEVAAKTGTTNFDSQTKSRYNMSYNAVNDLWVAGYNPEYAIAVWYGYPSLDGYANKGYYNKFSSAENTRLWAAIANKMFNRNARFKISSSGVETVNVEKDTYPAKLASEFTPKEFVTTELFKSGTAPTEVSDRFARLNDVTNLNIEVSNLRAKLTWTGISTPKYLDEEFLKEYFKGIYKSESDQQKFLKRRIELNQKTLGSVIYNIYIRNENGELVNIGSTKDTSFEYKISAPTTFVVKAAYELFNKTYGIDNSSIGTEIRANFSASLIFPSLKGDRKIIIKKGKQLIDEGVQLFENGIEVTNFTVNKKYYLESDLDNPITDINTNNVGKYRIKYEISYNSYSNVLWREIEIQEDED